MAKQKVLANGLELEERMLAHVRQREGESVGDAVGREVKEQLAAREQQQLREWFVSLPLADKQRIYDAEHA